MQGIGNSRPGGVATSGWFPKFCFGRDDVASWQDSQNMANMGRHTDAKSVDFDMMLDYANEKITTTFTFFSDDAGNTLLGTATLEFNRAHTQKKGLGLFLSPSPKQLRLGRFMSLLPSQATGYDYADKSKSLVGEFQQVKLYYPSSPSPNIWPIDAAYSGQSPNIDVQVDPSNGDIASIRHLKGYGPCCA